jgi:hypothetical protein
VDSVRAARLDEVGPVVEDEERSVRVARCAKGLRRCDERVVVDLLVPQLNDVDATAKRGLEYVGVAAGEDEVEP